MGIFLTLCMPVTSVMDSAVIRNLCYFPVTFLALLRVCLFSNDFCEHDRKIAMKYTIALIEIHDQ